MVKEKSF